MNRAKDVTLWVMTITIAALFWVWLDARQEASGLRNHVEACRQVIDGEYLLPMCMCGSMEASIEATCTRADYAHYEVMWNAEHLDNE